MGREPAMWGEGQNNVVITRKHKINQHVQVDYSVRMKRKKGFVLSAVGTDGGTRLEYIGRKQQRLSLLHRRRANGHTQQTKPDRGNSKIPAMPSQTPSLQMLSANRVRLFPHREYHDPTYELLSAKAIPDSVSLAQNKAGSGHSRYPA